MTPGAESHRRAAYDRAGAEIAAADATYDAVQRSPAMPPCWKAPAGPSNPSPGTIVKETRVTLFSRISQLRQRMHRIETELLWLTTPPPYFHFRHRSDISFSVKMHFYVSRRKPNMRINREIDELYRLCNGIFHRNVIAIDFQQIR